MESGSADAVQLAAADGDALVIRGSALGSEAAQALITALNAELSALYPEPGATHFRLDEDELLPGRGAFFVAWLHGSAVACGGVRRLAAGDAEIKRMYVVPAARGRGIGRALLAQIEAAARALGAHRLVLETGVRQPEALALYTRAGFERCAAFGDYTDSPLSLCMARILCDEH